MNCSELMCQSENNKKTVRLKNKPPDPVPTSNTLQKELFILQSTEFNVRYYNTWSINVHEFWASSWIVSQRSIIYKIKPPWYLRSRRQSDKSIEKLTQLVLSSSFIERQRAAAAICEGRYCTMSYSTIVNSIRYLANVCLLASTCK